MTLRNAREYVRHLCPSTDRPEVVIAPFDYAGLTSSYADMRLGMLKRTLRDRDSGEVMEQITPYMGGADRLYPHVLSGEGFIDSPMLIPDAIREFKDESNFDSVPDDFFPLDPRKYNVAGGRPRKHQSGWFKRKRMYGTAILVPDLMLLDPRNAPEWQDLSDKPDIKRPDPVEVRMGDLEDLVHSGELSDGKYALLCAAAARMRNATHRLPERESQRFITGSYGL